MNYLALAKFLDSSGFFKLYDIWHINFKSFELQKSELVISFVPNSFKSQEIKKIKISLTPNDYNNLLIDNKLIVAQTRVDSFSHNEKNNNLTKGIIYKILKDTYLDIDNKINYYNVASALVKYDQFMAEYKNLNMNIQKVSITKSAIYLTGIPLIYGIEPYDNLVHFKLDLPTGLYNTFVSDSDIYGKDSFINIDQKSSDVYDKTLEINQNLLNKTIKEFSFADDNSIDVNLTYGRSSFSMNGNPKNNTPYDRLASEALKYPEFRNALGSADDFSIKLFAIEAGNLYIRVIDNNGIVKDVKLKITDSQYAYFNKAVDDPNNAGPYFFDE